MEKLQKIFLGIGFGLLVLIPVWIFLIVPELEKLPVDHNFKVQTHTIGNPQYEVNAERQTKTVFKGQKEDKVIGVKDNTLVIERTLQLNYLHGEKYYGTSQEFEVERKTRHNTPSFTDKEGKAFFYFPSHVEKKSYDQWPAGYFKSHQFDFVNVENIKGLETYYFKADKKIDPHTDAYKWLELVPDTYDVDTLFTAEFWVEPVSGTIIRYRDEGTNYYTDKESGERVWDIDYWSNDFTDDTIANQVRIAQYQKQQIILYEIMIPILLAVIAIALLIASYVGGFLKNRGIKEDKK